MGRGGKSVTEGNGAKKPKEVDVKVGGDGSG